jgi:hypothetical protein
MNTHHYAQAIQKVLQGAEPYMGAEWTMQYVEPGMAGKAVLGFCSTGAGMVGSRGYHIRQRLAASCASRRMRK